MPFTIITQGNFTSAGVGVKIPIPQSLDYFVSTNVTQMAAQQNPGRCVRGEWYRNGANANDADNLGLRWLKANSSDAIEIDSFANATASDGFTYVESVPFVEAAQTGTAITNADPAVVTINGHGYSNGDRVRLYNTTGMLQIAGMDFTISSVTTNTFELLGLDASGFADAATAVTARRISKLNAVEPRFLYISNISQATEAVVSVTTNHNYVVGELIHFQVDQAFGMQEISGMTGRITAVTDYTMTVNIDSSGFTAFAFPASADAGASKLFATLAPAGQRVLFNPISGLQTGYDFDHPVFQSGQFVPYINLAAGANSPAGSSGDVIVWQAYKSEVALIN